MTSSPSLSILVASLGRREKKLSELLSILAPQIIENGIEIVIYWNNGEKKIGDYRQALLEEAKGDYVCFVDDDDRVPYYYCHTILQNLGKDYIGFEVELFNEGKKMPRVFHSIRYGVWHQDEKGYYRGVTHLNPVKRELALTGTFSNGIGEDETWARMVAPHIRTENYIDKIMYYYHHDKDETFFGGVPKPEKLYIRPDLPYYGVRYHPDSPKEGIS